MIHFWNSLSPQVQVEAIKLLEIALFLIAGSLLLFVVKFKYQTVEETRGKKKNTVIEFEGGLKKK